jgi:hypothetical protein
MFSNIEEILSVNQKFLAAIVTRRDEDPVIEGIGDILMSMVRKIQSKFH